jgi:hypothetical protein
VTTRAASLSAWFDDGIGRLRSILLVRKSAAVGGKPVIGRLRRALSSRFVAADKWGKVPSSRRWRVTPPRNPRCFNGLPYRCEFPQVKIVCQQIRGHSIHNFGGREIGVAFEKAAHTASPSARTPPERHAPASARTANEREPRSRLRADWSVYELTHRAPGSPAGRGFEKYSHGMPPNLLAHYCYLWEPTAVRQAVETAWISASVRRTSVEVLVPAG